MDSKAPLTGGARIGGFNASWPFAKLHADAEGLTIKLPFSKTYRFPTSSITSVREYISILFIGWGIRIEHSVPEYPPFVVFWYLGYPSTVLSFLEDCGFPIPKNPTDQKPPG